MKSLKAEIKRRIEVKNNPPPKPPPKYQGTGTRARLNTAAEKNMFNKNYST